VRTTNQEQSHKIHLVSRPSSCLPKQNEDGEDVPRIGDMVKIPQDLHSIRMLLMEFTCRNHITSLISPQTKARLQPFLLSAETPYTSLDYARLRDTSPAALLDLIQFGKEVGPVRKLSDSCISLLELMIDLQIADTQIKYYKVPHGRRAHDLPVDMQYAGRDLPKVVGQLLPVNCCMCTYLTTHECDDPHDCLLPQTDW
jgi:hypothetical protein